jgi:uncharacterized protein (DUF885 family)
VRALKWLAGALAVALLAATALGVHTWYFKPLRIEWFYGRLFASFALQQPELMSALRAVPGWLAFYDADLDDASPAHEQRVAEIYRSGLATLHRYDPAALDHEARLSYDTLEYFLQSKVDGERFRDHDFPVNQLFGLQSELPNFMVQVHQVTSAHEAHTYVTRLEKVPVKFDQALQSLRLRESRGVLPPQFTVEKVLAQMKAFVAVPPQQNVLYTSFRDKLERIPSERMGAGERAALLRQVEGTIGERVYPAYRRLIDYFTALAPKAQGNFGAWHLPDGDAYYAWCVRDQTTTDMTPEQVHALGLAEVARIDSEMDAILRTRGLVDGTIGERVGRLSRDPQQLLPNTADGKRALLAAYRVILDEAEAALPRAFDIRPAGALDVQPVPSHVEATAPGAYYNGGALDGSRPGVFYVNTRDPSATPRFAMRTLAYHEGVPGHHLQISVAQHLPGVPFFRRIIPFTAYLEGWALYAEQLAFEIGLESDPLDNLGRLQAEMFRAVRLVVDTGIHAKRWTREQSIAYMVEHTGMGTGEVTGEIERYFVNPGQALAYKVGVLKILALREKAQRALGPKFDLKRFHDEVLLHGALPLVVLEHVIDEWIAAAKGP